MKFVLRLETGFKFLLLLFFNCRLQDKLVIGLEQRYGKSHLALFALEVSISTSSTLTAIVQRVCGQYNRLRGILGSSRDVQHPLCLTRFRSLSRNSFLSL